MSMPWRYTRKCLATAKLNMATKEPFKVLVERNLILKNQGARSKSKLKILIGVPRWAKKGKEAAWPVAAEGLVGRIADIRGIDPMQAIELALAPTNSLIKNLPPGKKVTWPNGEPYDAEGLTGN
jgi:hypothetical protein